VSCPRPLARSRARTGTSSTGPGVQASWVVPDAVQPHAASHGSGAAAGRQARSGAPGNRSRPGASSAPSGLPRRVPDADSPRASFPTVCGIGDEQRSAGSMPSGTGAGTAARCSSATQDEAAVANRSAAWATTVATSPRLPAPPRGWRCRHGAMGDSRFSVSSAAPGRPPDGPRPQKLPCPPSVFGASRYFMDSRTWSTSGPAPYLAVHERTPNSRSSAQVALALRYTWHSPRGGRAKRTGPGGSRADAGYVAATDGVWHRFLRGLAGIDGMRPGICGR
jgi:hypothetical protein